MALLLLWLTGPQAQAAAKEEYKMNIKISGTVISTGNCTFAQGKSLEVDFGEVLYDPQNRNALSGAYRKTLDSTMNCKGDSAGTTQMTLSSASTVSHGGHALLPVTYSDGSASPNLVIRLRVNGAIQDFNQPFTVDLTNSQSTILDVELVKLGDGKTFSRGKTFTASATLAMAFI